MSQLVLDECSAGDADAAKDRLAELNGIPVLSATEPVTMLAATIANDLSLPPKAVNDAVHIAISAVHGVEYLLTWNCTHINNVATIDEIRNVCEDHGYACPVICTPDELIRI